MSEYQYYEFAAIDRPLTRVEMAELRAVSTRADITSSSFINEYQWGDLKADPTKWMRRYFDAFVYTANWCSCRLALRVPLSTFRKAELKPFTTSQTLMIDATKTHWIFDWTLDDSEDYDRFGMEDGSGWMQRLAPLRDELLRSDLRPLYLGWLATAARGDLDDDEMEPAVPSGLSVLSVPQQALVEFLEIDPDMLTAATENSHSHADGNTVSAKRIDAWLKEWPNEEMAAVIKLIAQDQGHVAERQVKTNLNSWLKAQRSSPQHSLLRSVGQLRELAQDASHIRLDREATARKKQMVAQQRKRKTHLRSLMTDVNKRWGAIEAEIQRGTAAGYDRATIGLTELAEGYSLTDSRKKFDHALRRFLKPHLKRGALLRRLAEAGLWLEV